ncbi:MAG: hypothetical protein ABI841_06635 [Chloroflexota bacterium]
MHIWSERGGARAREIAVDIATLAWIVLWVTIGIRVYGFLANLAEAGRLVQRGGLELHDAGDSIGGAFEGVPLVGEGAASGIRDAFAAAGDPLVAFGMDLERALIAIAVLVALLVAAAGLVPWLNRYLPWRVERWSRLNAATRVIRRRRFASATPVPAPEIERLLASRALHRLEYDELLRFSPDPFGDWSTGRHDRLARAELDRAGLQTLGVGG